MISKYILTSTAKKGRFLQLALALGLGLLPGLVQAGLAESLDSEFQLVNPQNRVNEVVRVIHDGSRYVAVNQFGAISTSTDGESWSTSASGVALEVIDMAYGGGTYVIVGAKNNSAVIAVSTNLKDWTLGSGVSGATVHSVAFFDGHFYVAYHNIFQGGLLARSTNASAGTWEEHVVNGTSGHARVLRPLNGRLFLATTSLTGSDLQIFSSTNGTDFTKASIDGTNFSQLGDIIYGGGLYLIYGTAGIATSTDGETFTRSFPLGNFGSFSLVGYGKGKFFGRTAGSRSDFYHSDNGTDWTKGEDNTLSAVGAVATNGTSIVGLGSDARVSSDGINWESVVFSDIDPALVSRTSSLIQAAYGNGLYVISRSSASPSGGRAIPSGPYWISENGVDWAEGTESLGSIVAGNGVFVGIRQGRLVRSEDAQTWQAVGPEGEGIFRLAFDGSTFLATSGGNRAYTSTDGSTWLYANEGGSGVGHGGPLVGGDGEWISLGTGGSYSRSLDGGVTWTNHVVGNSTLNAAAYGNGRWVVVAQNGRLYSRTSLSGTWATNGNGPTLSDGGSYRSVIFHDGLFYVYRDNFGTYLVSDGEGPWVEKVFAHSTELYSVAQGPEFAVILGRNNAIFSTGEVEGGNGGTGSSYGPLHGLVDLGGGVKWSAWLGFLYTFEEGWIYHYDLGFLYLYGTDDSGFWFWDHATGGFWYTSKTVYPYLFRNDDGIWYYFIETDASGNRHFYHSGNQNTVTLGKNL